MKPDACSSFKGCKGGDYCKECSHAYFDGKATVNGREWRWEFNPQFGPLFLRKKGEPMKRQPGEKNPVWGEFEKWHKKQKELANGS